MRGARRIGEGPSGCRPRLLRSVHMTRTVDDASLGECLKISMELPGREPAEDDVVRRCVVLHDQAHTTMPPATSAPTAPDSAPAATMLVVAADRSPTILTGAPARRQKRARSAPRGNRGVVSSGGHDEPAGPETYSNASMAPLPRLL